MRPAALDQFRQSVHVTTRKREPYPARLERVGVAFQAGLVGRGLQYSRALLVAALGERGGAK